MQNCKKVTLRLRHCKHGKMSYYLDYYPPYRDKKTMKTIRHEYLGIYIYESPKNSHELAFNKTMEKQKSFDAEDLRKSSMNGIIFMTSNA